MAGPSTLSVGHVCPQAAPGGHLGHVVGVGTQDSFESIGLPQQLGHGTWVLSHILGSLALALFIKEPSQVLTKAEFHLQAPQGTVKPIKEREQRRCEEHNVSSFAQEPESHPQLVPYPCFRDPIHSQCPKCGHIHSILNSTQHT